MITPQETSEIVKLAMEKFRCTQRELAQILEVSDAIVSKWVHAKRSIGKSTLKVLDFELKSYRKSGVAND